MNVHLNAGELVVLHRVVCPEIIQMNLILYFLILLPFLVAGHRQLIFDFDCNAVDAVPARAGIRVKHTYLRLSVTFEKPNRQSLPGLSCHKRGLIN